MREHYAIYLEPEKVTPVSIQFRLVKDETDLPQLIELAKEAHQESRFRAIDFSADKVRKTALSALKNPKRHGVMLAERQGQPVGFAHCSIGEYHIGTGALLATIHNINVRRDVRCGLGGGRIALGLFKGIETWSQARGAQEVLLHVTSGSHLAQAHKLAKRIGFTLIGGSYAKVI